MSEDAEGFTDSLEEEDDDSLGSDLEAGSRGTRGGGEDSSSGEEEDGSSDDEAGAAEMRSGVGTDSVGGVTASGELSSHSSPRSPSHMLLSDKDSAIFFACNFQQQRWNKVDSIRLRSIASLCCTHLDGSPVNT